MEVRFAEDDDADEDGGAFGAKSCHACGRWCRRCADAAAAVLRWSDRIDDCKILEKVAAGGKRQRKIRQNTLVKGCDEAHGVDLMRTMVELTDDTSAMANGYSSAGCGSTHLTYVNQSQFS